MKQEDKELLLKDLCGRLPYGVKVLCLRDFNRDWYNLEMVDIGDNEVYVTTYEPYANRYVKIEEVKPYLFHLSSMTEEQRNELKSLLRPSVLKSLDEDYEDNEDIEFPTLISANPSVVEIDYYNKNHFDYRGLIPKGLAIDCTNLNIY